MLVSVQTASPSSASLDPLYIAGFTVLAGVIIWRVKSYLGALAERSEAVKAIAIPALALLGDLRERLVVFRAAHDDGGDAVARYFTSSQTVRMFDDRDLERLRDRLDEAKYIKAPTLQVAYASARHFERLQEKNRNVRDLTPSQQQDERAAFLSMLERAFSSLRECLRTISEFADRETQSWIRVHEAMRDIPK